MVSVGALAALLDVNGDGIVTVDEAKQVLHELAGDDADAYEQVAHSVEEMDINGDGVLDLSELMKTVEESPAEEAQLGDLSGAEIPCSYEDVE